MSLDSFLQTVQTKASPVNDTSFVEAQFHHVEEDGLYFTVKAWDERKHVFGPAYWPAGSVEPELGSTILVMFLGAGIERPWVLVPSAIPTTLTSTTISGNLSIAGTLNFGSVVGAGLSWLDSRYLNHADTNYVSSLVGTANQITASAATGAVTLSLPSTLIAPGTVQATSLGINIAPSYSLHVNKAVAGDWLAVLDNPTSLGYGLLINSGDATREALRVRMWNGEEIFWAKGSEIRAQVPVVMTSTLGVTGAVTLSSTLDFVSVTGAGLSWLDARYVNHSDGFVSSITGTANQISASAATGAVTLSLAPVLILGTPVAPIPGTRIAIKSPGSDGWGIAIEAMSNDRTLAIGHNNTDAVISSSYRTSGGWGGLVFQTMDTTRLTISAAGAATFSGNVGIGIVPIYKLHVEGGSIYANSGTTNTVGGNGASDIYGSQGYWGIRTNTVRSFIIDTYTLAGAWQESLSVTRDGAVAMASTLAVTGAATFSSTLTMSANHIRLGASGLQLRDYNYNNLISTAGSVTTIGNAAASATHAATSSTFTNSATFNGGASFLDAANSTTGQTIKIGFQTADYHYTIGRSPTSGFLQFVSVNSGGTQYRGYSFDAAVTMASTLAVTGAITGASLDVAGGITLGSNNLTMAQNGYAIEVANHFTVLGNFGLGQNAISSDRLYVVPSAAMVGVGISGASGQTADLLQISAYGGTAGGLFKVASSGAVTLSSTLTVPGTISAVDDLLLTASTNLIARSGTATGIYLDAGTGGWTWRDRNNGYATRMSLTAAGDLSLLKADARVYLGAATPAAGLFPRIYLRGASGVAAVINRGTASDAIYFGEGSDSGAYYFRGSGTFSVEGATSLGNTLAVTGASTFSAPITLYAPGSANVLDLSSANGSYTAIRLANLGVSGRDWLIAASNTNAAFGTGNFAIYENSYGTVLTISPAGLVTVPGTLAVTGTSTLNGAVTIAAGLTPSLRFVGDSDTGIGNPATDVVSMVAGGITAVRATTTGVTMPGTLAVTGAATAASFKAGTISSLIPAYARVAAQESVAAVDGDKFIYLYTNGATFKLDAYDMGVSGGPLPIQIAGNGGAITLAGATTVTGAATFQSTLNVTGAVTFTGTVTQNNTLIFGGSSYIRGNALYGVLVNNSGDSLNLFRIKDNGDTIVIGAGKLGVGLLWDATPAYKLDVQGTLGATGAATFQSTILMGVGARPLATPTGWGYEPTTYRAIMLGSPSTLAIENVTLSFNYDPSINVSGTFNGGGQEIIFRRGTQFVTPNAANTAWNLRNLVLLDGMVGIGATPAARLDNRGTLNTGSVSTSGLNWYVAEATKYAASIKNGGGHALHLEATGGGYGLIVEAGNVGIGNSAPGTLLDVGLQGSLRGNVWLRATGEAGAYLAMFSPNGGYYDVQADDASLHFRPSGVTTGLVLTQTTGRVGIGAAPSYKLDVFSSDIRFGDGGSSTLHFNTPNVSTVSAHLRVGGADRLSIRGDGLVTIPGAATFGSTLSVASWAAVGALDVNTGLGANTHLNYSGGYNYLTHANGAATYIRTPTGTAVSVVGINTTIHGTLGVTGAATFGSYATFASSGVFTPYVQAVGSVGPYVQMSSSAVDVRRRSNDGLILGLYETGGAQFGGTLGVTGAATLTGGVTIGAGSYLTFMDISGGGGTYEADIVRDSSVSPWRVLIYRSRGGGGGWYGAHHFQVSFNAGTPFDALTLRANSDNATAAMGLTGILNVTGAATFSSIVGIGGAGSATAPLTIQTDSSGRAIWIEGGPGWSQIHQRSATASLEILTNGTGSILFRPNNATALTLANGGAATFASTLTAPYVFSTSYLFVGGGATSAYFAGQSILFGYAGGQNYQHRVGTRHHAGQAIGNAIDFYVWNYGVDTAGTPGTKHVMTLDGNGSVGIGVLAPSYKLDVVGSYTTARFGKLTITDDTPFVTGPNIDGGSNTLGIGTTGAGAFMVFTNNAARLTIRGDGLVGIGRTPTTDKLEVAGGVLFQFAAGLGLRLIQRDTNSIGALIVGGDYAFAIDALNNRVGFGGQTDPLHTVDITGTLRATGVATFGSSITALTGGSTPWSFGGDYNRMRASGGFHDVEAYHSMRFIIDTSLNYSDRTFGIYRGGSNILGTGSPVNVFLVDEQGQTTITETGGSGGYRPALRVRGNHSTTSWRLTLPAASNGGGTGDVSLQAWVSEPGVTWSGAGIGHNVTNDGGGSIGFGILNSGFGASMIRFTGDSVGTMIFYTATGAGVFTNPLSLNVNGVYANVGLTAASYVDVTGNLYARAEAITYSNVRASNYALRATGWQVNSVGLADFRSVFVDELQAKEFVVDQTAAYAGSLIIAKSASTLYFAFVAPKNAVSLNNKALTANVATLTTNFAHSFVVGDVVVISIGDATFDGTYTITAVPLTTTFSYAKTAANVASTATSGTASHQVNIVVRDISNRPNVWAFASGDSVAVQIISDAGAGLVIGDCVGVVTRSSIGGGAQTYTFVRSVYGGGVVPGTTFPVDAPVIDYGTSGYGAIEMTTLDGPGKPWMGVKTWANSPAVGNWTSMFRAGYLDGVTSAVNELGMIAGVYTATPTSSTKYIRASNQEFTMFGMDLSLYDGSNLAFAMRRNNGVPYFAIGNPAPSTYGALGGIWMGRHAATGEYRFSITNPAGTQQFAYDGTNVIIYGGVYASYGTIGGLNMAAAKIYVGAGNWANADTAFYVSNDGSFSLKDALYWNSATSALTIKGGIYAGSGTFTGKVTAGYVDIGKNVGALPSSLLDGIALNNTDSSYYNAWLTRTDGTTYFSVGDATHRVIMDTGGSGTYTLTWPNFTVDTSGNVAIKGTGTIGTHATNKINLVSTATANTTAIYSGTSTYGTGGFWLDASGRFSLGTGLTYDGAGNLTITAAISGGTIDIGGADTTSFHVDSAGQMWSGAATYVDAPWRVSSTGAMRFYGLISGNPASITISQGAADGRTVPTILFDGSGYEANGAAALIKSNQSLTIEVASGLFSLIGVDLSATFSESVRIATTSTVETISLETYGTTASGAILFRPAVGTGSPVPTTVLSVTGGSSILNTTVGVAGKLTVADRATFSNDLYVTGNYGYGIVGLYSTTRYQGVFAMGDSYKLPADGTTPGDLHGIAWTYQGMGQAKAGLSHQALFMIAGVTQTAIGAGIWTIGDVSAVAYVTRSDEVLKQDAFMSFGGARERLREVKPKAYRLNANPDRWRFGVIAQDLHGTAFAELVYSDGEHLGVDYQGLIVPTIAAVQEIDNEVEELRSQMEAQTKEIAALKVIMQKKDDVYEKTIEEIEIMMLKLATKVESL